MAFDASELLTPARNVNDVDLEVVEDGWAARFRLPDSYDVAAALAGEDLAARLVSVIPREARDSSPGAIELPWLNSGPASLSLLAMTSKVASRIAELDPQADISLDLSCAACDHRWHAYFDPAAFLFREIEAAVGRLTNEVHQLARAYAWSEESILAMGATRRRRYLCLVAQ